MRVEPGTHIVRRIAGHHRGARARRRGAAAVALALPLAAATLTAAPAPAAVRYMVTHTIRVSGGSRDRHRLRGQCLLVYRVGDRRGQQPDTGNIHVRYNPDLVAVDPATHTLYAGTAHSDGTLSVIDEAANQITHTTDIGTPVRGLAVDPAAGTAYVISRGLVFVDDLATNTVIAQVPVAGSAAAAVDPARDTAYVAGSTGVSVIQPCR